MSSSLGAIAIQTFAKQESEEEKDVRDRRIFGLAFYLPEKGGGCEGMTIGCLHYKLMRSRLYIICHDSARVGKEMEISAPTIKKPPAFTGVIAKFGSAHWRGDFSPLLKLVAGLSSYSAAPYF